MISWRGAWLGACLALPFGAAAAAQPEGHYVYVPPGAMVLVLPAPAAMAVPAGFPMAPMLAPQNGLIRRMMADIDAMIAMPFPDPQDMVRSVMQGMPRGVPGSGVVMTSLSTGNGVCRETITYGLPGADGQPQVKVTRTGNACGAVTTSGPLGVTETLPAPAMPAPTVPRGEKLWSVGYPPQPVTRAAPPRT